MSCMYYSLCYLYISYDWIFVFLPGVSGGELLVPRTHLKSGYSGRRGSGDEASLRHGHLNHRAAARRGSGDVDLLRRSLTHKADAAGESCLPTIAFRLYSRPSPPPILLIIPLKAAYKEVGPYSSRAVNAKNFIAAQLNSGSTRPAAEATSLRYAEEGTDADSPTAGSNASLASSKASSRASSRASLTGLVYTPII